MNVTAYDFMKPAPLAAEWQQRLGDWFRPALTLADRAWARESPCALQSTYLGADTARAGTALAAGAEPAVGYALALGADRVTTMLLLPRRFLLVVAAGLLGESPDRLPPDRDLTPVEDSLADYFLHSVLCPCFQRTWPGPEVLAWGAPAKETYPQESRLFRADEPVVVLAWSAAGAFGELTCRWVMSKAALLRAAGPAEPAPAPGPSPAVSAESAVRGLPVELAVRLGTAELRLSDLARLQPGDLVVLDQRVNEPLVALVGGREKFRGWAGRSGSARAFQVHVPTGG